MKKLTQEVFDGAPDWVKSAAVDNVCGSQAYWHSLPKKQLKQEGGQHWPRDAHNSYVGYKTKPIGSGYDTTDWQNSAIDREV